MRMIGKVVEYDGATGTIATLDHNYRFLFLKKDLSTDISVGDIVEFSGEAVHDTLRAYFIKSIEYKNNIEVKIKTKKRES